MLHRKYLVHRLSSWRSQSVFLSIQVGVDPRSWTLNSGWYNGQSLEAPVEAAGHRTGTEQNLASPHRFKKGK